MGGGIAMSCANAGMGVFLVDVAQESLDKGIAVIRSNYDRSVKRGHVKRGAHHPVFVVPDRLRILGAPAEAPLVCFATG
jgi:3-hydroxyacyl-CoA dehydrogenase